MTDNFIGEIQLFPYPYSPAGWAFCMGQILPITQNASLYSVMGTAFGGNGTSNFGIPNFQNSTACGVGQGPGLTKRELGESFGSESVTLMPDEIPPHKHAVFLYGQNDSTKRHGAPKANDGLVSPASTQMFTNAVNTLSGSLAPASLLPAGGNNGSNLPHDNRQPYLALNFCIALQGQYPVRI